jgi:phenylpropionate dioxygenase-like ring-hydroxylating dioxygenase large terminal subunit
LQKSEFGLIPVRSEILLGLVFVCLAGDPPPLALLWQPFLAELAPYRIADMVPLGPIHHEDWEADWKVAMENYLESYHVPVGHPGLFRMFTADYVGQVNLTNGLARGVGRMRDRTSAKWGEREYQKLVDTAADHLPEDDRRAWRYYSLMPNIGIDIFPDQIDFFQVLPRGPGKCTIRAANFALPDGRREMRLLRYLNQRINRQVQREDAFLTQRVQRGLASSGWRPGPLSLHEACIAQFHDRLRTRIPEIDLPTPPPTFA